MTTQPPPGNVLSIAQLTQAIKYQLNQEFPAVWVRGELSGIHRPASGHVYLTLKDSQSQINAIIWRSDAEALKFDLTTGLKVICRGGVDVYAQRGSYQLIIRRIQPEGIGERELAFRQLHQKLSTAGLFDPIHKRPLPTFPNHVAVVTSPTGAAVRDFLQVIQRRWPKLHVTIVPTRVQGPGSANEIAAAIDRCQDLAGELDVLVITRGGGSIEDLWAFNEEVVVRAIYESSIPTICGVGHEVDITLSDLAADVRALTPSEAAERLVPRLDEQRHELQRLRRHLDRSVQTYFLQAQRQLEQTASRPVLRRPLDRIQRMAIDVDYLEQNLKRSTAEQLRHYRRQLQSLTERMQTINPLAVLARGYSLTSDVNGKLLLDCQAVAPGDTLETRLAHGKLTSVVTSVQPESNP